MIYEYATEAVTYIRQLSDIVPNVALILGSGLGGFAECVEEAVSIPFAAIPHFPQSGVVGHSGNLVLGTISGVPVAVLQGRVHAYEGHDAESITFATRVVRLLGANTLIVTNAAGAINPEYTQGALVVISDHINLTDINAAAGPNDLRFGERFFDMSEAYSRRLRDIAMAAATRNGPSLHAGVYLAVLGPSFETPAEIRAFRTLGADLVGMSTVHEVIVARHMGMEVLGLSLVTNMAAGVVNEVIDHNDVLEVGRMAERRFTELLVEVIPQL